MAGTTTREQFVEQAGRFVADFAGRMFDELVDRGDARPDRWLRERGGALLRQMAGLAFEVRSNRMGMAARCECGCELEFRQHRQVRVHTILPGRDVDTWLRYGQCPRCRKGFFPLLREMDVDAEGFTPELREMALLAGVVEPYASAAEQLLARFAMVEVSTDKMRSLVAQQGEKAEQFLARSVPPPPDEQVGNAHTYVMIDGGMIHVEKAWQECKLAVLFSEDERVQTGNERHELREKQVVGVRGTPEDLAAILRPRIEGLGVPQRAVVCVADGARWVWNFFAQHFPERIEILDWFHLKEHMAHAAAALYGEGSDEAGRWCAVQLDRLEHDEVGLVFDALRFARKETRAKAKREALDDLERYLDANRERIRYGTFRAQGLLIGSGAIEGAMNHVVQQRMKRPGMRWKADGADHMLALRCIYRSTGHWDEFLSWRRAA